MKPKEKNNNIFKVAGIILAILVLFLVAFVFSKRGADQSNLGDTTAITIEKDGAKVNIHNNGQVEYKTGSDSAFKNITKEEVKKLSQYLISEGLEGILDGESGNYYIVIIYQNGEEIILYIPKGDGVLDVIYDTLEDEVGDGGGDTGGGDDPFDFSTPTPSPDSGDDDGDDGSGTGGGGIKPDDCPLWLLSFCVYPHDTPEPDATPTVAPEVEPDCSYWQRFIHKYAIISNTYCVDEEVE